MYDIFFCPKGLIRVVYDKNRIFQYVAEARFRRTTTIGIDWLAGGLERLKNSDAVLFYSVRIIKRERVCCCILWRNQRVVLLSPLRPVTMAHLQRPARSVFQSFKSDDDSRPMHVLSDRDFQEQFVGFVSRHTPFVRTCTVWKHDSCAVRFKHSTDRPALFRYHGTW